MAHSVEDENEFVDVLNHATDAYLRRLLAHTAGILAERQGVIETVLQLGRIQQALCVPRRADA